MASRIGKVEWVAAYVGAGVVDVAQWIFDATGFGAGFNEIADPIIGVILGGYFQLRGVSMIKNWTRLASLVGATVLEEVSISIAPAWIIDVWYIHRTVKQEDAKLAARREQEAMLENNIRQPLYEDGVRAPRKRSTVQEKITIADGIRAPGGGLSP